MTISEKNFNLVRDGFDLEDAAGYWSADVKAYADATTLKSMFFGEDWVFITVDLCALKIASQELRVMRKFIRDGKLVVEPAPLNPVNQIFEQPNNFQDYHAWMYWVVVDLIMTGNSVCWAQNLSKKIVPLPAESIAINFDEQGDIKNYVTREYYGEGEAYTHASMSTFNKDQIIHIKRPNPSSLIWGLSPFVPGRKSILFNRYSSEYLNNFYLKGATPGFALEMKEEANEQSAMRMLRSFEMAYTGRRNQRRTMVLPKGVEIKQVTSSIGDQQLTSLVDKNRETIIALLKVPKHELGLQTGGSLGSEEYKTALKNFWSATIVPHQRMIAGALTKHYSQYLGVDHFIEFDNTNVDILQDDLDTKAILAERMLKTHTLNEVRSIMYDLPAIAGGDIVGQAPMFMPTQQFSLPPSPIKSKKIKTARFKSVMAESSRRIDESIKKDTNAIIDNTLSMFSEMAEAMARVVKKELRDLYKADLPRKSALKRQLRKSLDGFDEQWVDDTKRILEQQTETGYSLALDVPWNAADQQQINALRERNKKDRLEILEQRLFSSFENMNKTTTESVINTLADMAEENATIDDMVKTIEREFSDFDKIGYRADRIARTETLTALSIGQAAAMKDAATVVPNLKKIWLTMDDDRVRDSHAAMDGDVEDWDAPFDNGMQFPRDPSAEAGDTINCFPSNTNISALNVEKSYQRFYRGKMVTVNFKSGNKLTGTPNHPVLTTKGWVGLGSLTKGNQVFKASGFNCSVTSNEMNIKKIESTIGNVHKSFLDSSHRMRVTGTIMDFHGDGTAENVDIINSDIRLQDRRKASAFKSCINLSLANANLAHGSAFSLCGNNKPSSGIGSSHSSISSSDLFSSSINIESRPFEQFSLGSSALNNADAFKSSDNSMSTDVSSPADLQNGQLLSDVHVDDVISVDVFSYVGHVYNLQTKDGYYIADNYVVHNCRCAFTALPEELMKEYEDEVS